MSGPPPAAPPPGPPSNRPPGRRPGRSGDGEPWPPDPRALRVEQAVVALLLLAGYVFGDWEAMPIAALLLAPGVIVGPLRGPLPRLFSSVGSSREPVPGELIRPHPRASAAVEVGVLLVGTLVAWAGAPGLGWVPGLAVAILAALDGVAGISLIGGLLHRFLA